MHHADLTAYVHFEDEEPVRAAVFESSRLFTQLVCVGRKQSYGPVDDPDSDAIVTVLAGECAFQVDRKRKRLKQWGAVLVPAGASLTATNASEDPLVLLLVTAPPPAPAEGSPTPPA